MVQGCPQGMLGLMDRVSHELPGVAVVQAVEDLSPFLAGGDQPCQPHLGQVLGHRCRRFSGNPGERVHGKLAVAEGQDQTHPGGIGEHGEDFHRQLNVLAVRCQLTSLRICIHTQIMSVKAGRGKSDLTKIPPRGIFEVLPVKWFVQADVFPAVTAVQPQHLIISLAKDRTDMCASQVRTELPIVAAEKAGCACCSTTSAKRPSLHAEGTDYSVTGLTCVHCVQTVRNAVTALDGVIAAAVDLVPGGSSRLTVSGPHTEESVRDAVASAGYSFSR